jgi:hypothetical protein
VKLAPETLDQIVSYLVPSQIPINGRNGKVWREGAVSLGDFRSLIVTHSALARSATYVVYRKCKFFYFLVGNLGFDTFLREIGPKNRNRMTDLTLTFGKRCQPSVFMAALRAMVDAHANGMLLSRLVLCEPDIKVVFQDEGRRTEVKNLFLKLTHLEEFTVAGLDFVLRSDIRRMPAMKFWDAYQEYLEDLAREEAKWLASRG